MTRIAGRAIVPMQVLSSSLLWMNHRTIPRTKHRASITNNHIIARSLRKTHVAVATIRRENLANRLASGVFPVRELVLVGSTSHDFTFIDISEFHARASLQETRLCLHLSYLSNQSTVFRLHVLLFAEILWPELLSFQLQDLIRVA